MNALISKPAAKHATSKLVSPPSPMNSAHNPFSLDRDEDCKSDLRRSKHHTRSISRHRRQGKAENCFSTTSKSVKCHKSSSESESDSDSSKNRNRKVHHSKDEGARMLARGIADFATHWNTIPTTSPINDRSTMFVSLKPLQN